MPKRRLSKQQNRRIRKNQKSAVSPPSSDDTAYLNPNPILKGIVVSHHGTQLEVEYATNGTTSQQRCYFRANLPSVVTGDSVHWQEDGEMGVVISVEPRRSELHRPDSYGHLKVIAANIDRVIIVIAPEPQAFSRLIDRYLVSTEHLSLAATIVLNKSDLLDNQPDPEIDQLCEVYRSLKYDVLTVSARTNKGLPQLTDILKNNTSIFVGQSGVGKSSLLNALLPNENVRIGELSKARAKGRHTTTHTQLYHFAAGGNCIDSPGIREFGLWHLHKDDILNGFVELRDIAHRCKYRNCRHASESGCAVKAALNSGALHQNRFESYQHILGTLDDVTMKTETKGKSHEE